MLATNSFRTLSVIHTSKSAVPAKRPTVSLFAASDYRLLCSAFGGSQLREDS
jgi:hypothetical protein